MKHSTRLISTVALALVASGAHAQFPGGGGFGGPPPGGGFQPSPAMQAKFQAWRQFRDSHKNVMSLQRTLGALSEIEQDPKTKLTKPQARAVLGVIHKWQSKPALTDAQARQVNTQITAPLSLEQIKKIATAAQDRRGGFGGPPPGGGFGGPPPGGGFGGRAGGPPRFDPASFPSPREYNPLDPATNPMTRARPRAQKRLADLMAALNASAR